MRLRVLDGTYAFCRLGGDEPLPPWFALDAPLAAALRRAGELTVVTDEARVPPGVHAQRGYAALEVDGPLDLQMTGVMATLSSTLAHASVPIMPLATYDTDVILVPRDRLGDATAALRAAGHTVEP
jgi:hypothetical protein